MQIGEQCQLRRSAIALVMSVAFLGGACGEDGVAPALPGPPARPPLLTIFGPTSGFIEQCQPIALKALALTQDGNYAPATGVTWSSSNPIDAPVTPDGEVLAKGRQGRVTFFATIGALSASTTFDLRPKGAFIVFISATRQSLFPGEGLQLTAFADRSDETFKFPATWRSLSPDVAVVDDDGFVTALKRGAVAIQATLIEPPDFIDYRACTPRSFLGSVTISVH
jgi:hypothetical protein